MNPGIAHAIAMNVNLIWAQSANGIIGHQGSMPWHLPEDLAHFKTLTLNHPVIMGRKTWDSLPERFRPLPKRRNIVVTRQANWADQHPGAIQAESIQAALSPALLGEGVDEVWVMGGGEIYAQCLPFATRAEVTEIHGEWAGDTPAPQLRPSEWRQVHRETHTAANGLRFDFVSHIRIAG